MEEIKISPLEFEVIYADGQRKRVPEGVLLGVEADRTITLHNGTDDPAGWFAAAGGMLVALNNCNALPSFVLNRLPDTESFKALKKLAEEVHRRIWLENPATFRLGQMDMRDSIADLLKETSKLFEDFAVGAVYARAAELVRSMEV